MSAEYKRLKSKREQARYTNISYLMRISAVLLVIPLLTGIRACSEYPSSFFDGLDNNKDAILSYSEWMKYYALPMHNHSIEHCSRKDFYLADCNSDDQLTWREYHDFRFEKASCQSAIIMTLRQRYEKNFKLQYNPSRGDFEKHLDIYYRELAAKEEELKIRYEISRRL